MEGINFSRYILDKISQHDNNKVALIDDDTQITFGELLISIRSCARYLQQSDLRPGDRVGMLMGDCIEWVVAFFAVVYAGGIPVLLSPRIPKKNLEDMIEICHARFIINSSTDIDLSDFSIYPGTTIISKHKILENYQPLDICYKWKTDEMSLWCSSSGTSGKGQRFVIHKHQTFFDAVQMNTQMHDITKDSVIFSTPKLSFQYGLMNMVYGLVQGSQVILSNKIPARSHVCDVVKSHQVTHFYTTPTIVTSMIKINQPSKDLDTVNYVVCGGEPLPKFVEKQFADLYGKPIFNGIGMAELITWATSQNLKSNKFGTIGIPMPGVICEVRDSLGKLCKVNEIGELYIKQSTMALMYWNFAEHSRETFANGWFKSRDIVYWDEDGYLVYVCRSDDLIRVKESYVNPIDIEEEILQHPAVEECVVVSIKNKFDMPEISSKIVLKDNYNLVARDIRQFLTGRLEMHKIPKHIDFVDTLPKTVTTKKIRNRERIST